jgi:hypothetical protein
VDTLKKADGIPVLVGVQADVTPPAAGSAPQTAPSEGSAPVPATPPPPTSSAPPPPPLPLPTTTPNAPPTDANRWVTQ